MAALVTQSPPVASLPTILGHLARDRQSDGTFASDDIAVALVDMACQACQERFRVAVSFDESTIRQRGDKYTLPTEGDIGSFNYGDPPSHDECVGNTMNVEAVRVLELLQANFIHQRSQILEIRSNESVCPKTSPSRTLLRAIVARVQTRVVRRSVDPDPI